MEEEGKDMSGRGLAARVGAALKAVVRRGRRGDGARTAEQEWAEIAEAAVEETARMIGGGKGSP